MEEGTPIIELFEEPGLGIFVVLEYDFLPHTVTRRFRDNKAALEFAEGYRAAPGTRAYVADIRAVFGGEAAG